MPSMLRRSLCWCLFLLSSPLASSYLQTNVNIRTRTSSSSPLFRQSTQLHVLNTPEAIIEKASTENLLDELIDESVRLAARRPIMMQFDPTGINIWRRWRGTVFAETWPSCLRNMLIATWLAIVYRAIPEGLKAHFSGFNILWGQLLSVTTFTLTFFLNQSYALWRKCYELSRRLQGRLLDVGMTMAAHAKRTSDTPSTYTPSAKQVLLLVARYIRVFNLFTYASFTRSHRPLLTPKGMRRLVERSLISNAEYDALTNPDLPATQRHNAILIWIIRLFNESRVAGHIGGGPGMEQQFMEKVHVIRAQYGAMGDELQGRMPLAYAHIVQVLVDVILLMYPFMALSSGMSPALSVLGCGLLTIFYQGLFDLAKHFLDPYDNENYGRGDDPLCVDTLIAESNAGSMRWFNAFSIQPWSTDQVMSGDLSEYIFPTRGYTAKELTDLREKEETERKEKAEQETRQEEEQERLEREREKEKLWVETTMTNLTALGGTLAVNETLSTVQSSDNSFVEKSFMDFADGTEGLNEIISTEDDADIGQAAQKAIDNMELEPEAELEPPTERDAMDEVKEVIKFVEKELAETEAILNAPPGAWTVDIGDEGNEPQLEVVEGENNIVEEGDLILPEASISGPVDGNITNIPLVAETGTSLSNITEATKAPASEMTYEEFQEKAKEILQSVEDEIEETERILNAMPGASSIDEEEDDDFLMNENQRRKKKLGQETFEELVAAEKLDLEEAKLFLNITDEEEAKALANGSVVDTVESKTGLEELGMDDEPKQIVNHVETDESKDLVQPEVTMMKPGDEKETSAEDSLEDSFQVSDSAFE